MRMMLSDFNVLYMLIHLTGVDLLFQKRRVFERKLKSSYWCYAGKKIGIFIFKE